MSQLTNLQKRDLSQEEAFRVYPQIAIAYEEGDFKKAVNLNKLYERLVDNAIFWELKGI